MVRSLVGLANQLNHANWCGRLFALGGTLTGIIGIISWWYLPPSPTQTKSKFRGKDGWFNEHEEKVMVNRILRDDPSKGDMHNRYAYLSSSSSCHSVVDLCLTDKPSI